MEEFVKVQLGNNWPKEITLDLLPEEIRRDSLNAANPTKAWKLDFREELMEGYYVEFEDCDDSDQDIRLVKNWIAFEIVDDYLSIFYIRAKGV